MRALILVAALLSACSSSDKNDPEQRRAFNNQKELSNPEAIGRLPDGRVLYHSLVQVKDYTMPQHVFYAGSDTTVNVSQKSPVSGAFIGEPQNLVIIDGHHYDIAEVRQALACDEAQRRKENK